MNKPITCVTAFIALFTTIAAASDFTFTTNSSTITITKYIGAGGAVAITNTINGLPVTAIGDEAFYDTNASEPRLRKVKVVVLLSLLSSPALN